MRIPLILSFTAGHVIPISDKWVEFTRAWMIQFDGQSPASGSIVDTNNEAGSTDLIVSKAIIRSSL